MNILRTYKILVVVLFFVLSCFGEDLFGQNTAKQKVQDAAGVLQRSLKSVPQQVLNESVCVLVVPRVRTAEMVIDASGFISCRIEATKSWSSPGSIRFQGEPLASLIKEHDLVFLAMNRKTAHSIISQKMLLDVDTRLVQGPISGKETFPAESIRFADILSYSTPIIGLSGQSLRYVSVNEDLDANKEIYGSGLENTLILGGYVQAPRVVAPFMKTLVPCWTDTNSSSRSARIRQAACENGAQVDPRK